MNKVQALESALALLDQWVPSNLAIDKAHLNEVSDTLRRMLAHEKDPRAGGAYGGDHGWLVALVDHKGKAFGELKVVGGISEHDAVVNAYPITPSTKKLWSAFAYQLAEPRRMARVEVKVKSPEWFDGAQSIH